MLSWSLLADFGRPAGMYMRNEQSYSSWTTGLGSEGYGEDKVYKPAFV
jgi:hypothetical protein